MDATERPHRSANSCWESMDCSARLQVWVGMGCIDCIVTNGARCNERKRGELSVLFDAKRKNVKDGFQLRARGSNYSTVTDFARLRGLSTSVPRAHAVW